MAYKLKKCGDYRTRRSFSKSKNTMELSDLLEVQKIILEKSNISGIYLKAGDINKDGKIDLHDLLYVQKHILGDKIKQ